MTTSPAVTFWGAAQTVTGSMHLVEAGGRRILLDCGLTRGPRHARHEHPGFPFDPRTIDAVVLSHAHIDHCGNLPRLVQLGFAGPIYCTPATRDLIALMLADSARIHEGDAWAERIIRPGDEKTTEPLTSHHQVGQTLAQCVPVPNDQPRTIEGDVLLRFVEAGHILGSAMVSLTFATPAGERRLTFTGDLGRNGLPLLRDPAPIPPGDLLICESTYGGRSHDAVAPTIEALAVVVRRTLTRGGKVLVPAFSLGRMQSVVHSLEQLIRAGAVPEVPVFVDSPLAGQIADVYRHHPESLSADAAAELAEHGDFFDRRLVHHVRDRDESFELDTRSEPCVILAASGMCDGGRIVHHLKHHLDDPRCTVVLVSYQAPHTLGRQLLEPRPTVRFHGRKWNFWAQVVELSGFSGHPDHNELLAFLAPLAGRVGKVRLVHGEPDAAGALGRALRDCGFDDVGIPAPGDTVRV